jgi:hypothetical protein
MRGWWFVAMFDMWVGAPSTFRKYSKEEIAALQRMLFMMTVAFLALLAIQAWMLRRLDDPLLIHIGLEFVVAGIAGAWIGRRLFVKLWPGLARISDQKAAERLARQDNF